MNLPGLKEIVRTAFLYKKFMTNGRPLPSIDFDHHIDVEITAVDARGLVSIVRCRDNDVLQWDTLFKREEGLQLAAGSVAENQVKLLVTAEPELARLFERTVNFRVSIMSFKSKIKAEPVDTPRPAVYRPAIELAPEFQPAAIVDPSTRFASIVGLLG